MNVLTVFAHPGYQPKDVLVQQQKVAQADALAFVAPVHFLSFPAIMKGWLDRVWTPVSRGLRVTAALCLLLARA